MARAARVVRHELGDCVGVCTQCPARSGGTSGRGAEKRHASRLRRPWRVVNGTLMTTTIDSFKSRASLSLGGRSVDIFRLDALTKAKVGDVATLPYSIRILLENLLRHEDNKTVTREHIEAVANWDPKAEPSLEIAYRPARVLLQDFTGVPCVV